MRPACLRNARSLASTPSPLLPFLAPRAFAEAPLITRHDDSRSQKEQEKKRGVSTGSLLGRHTRVTTTLAARYADIFSIARQQMRSYSTYGADVDAGGRTRRTKRPVSKRTPDIRAEVTRGWVRVGSRRAVPRLRIRKTVSVWGKVTPWSNEGFQHFTSSTTPQSGGSSREPNRSRHVAVSRRQRLRELRRLRKTFEIFRIYEAPKHLDGPKTLDGKYRSLQRRILALSARASQVVTLQKPLGFFTTSRWESITMAFAALNRNVFSGSKRRSHPIILKHHEMCAPWTARLFCNEDATGPDRVWKNWSAFDAETKEQYWPHLLIYIFDKFPHRALTFLQALTHYPCVESLDVRIIADAFEHLARIYVHENIWNPKQKGELQRSKPDFIPTFYHVFREHLAPHKRICSQDLLFCVAKLASKEDFPRVFALMKDSGANIEYDVFLHYVHTFAKAGEFRQALACLRFAVEGAEDEESRIRLANEKRFRWSCALTLRSSMTNKGNYHETTGIVAAFVDLGVKLDSLLYNVIIHNAMEAGDHETAFKVYNSLDENGLEPDKFTFSTLLHGCTMVDDPAKFNDFADYCAETAKEMKDPWLAADYLYFQFVRLYRESRNPEESLIQSEAILRTYRKFFNSRPLEPFWAANFTFHASPMTSSDGTLAESAFMDPPPMALYIMLQLEILKASSIGKDRVWTLYQKFTELIQSKHDTTLSKLAKNPIIWNAFLLSFCRAQHFEHASQVVYDMPAHGCRPNVYTWNIFMQGFFKSQQIQAAERVYEIMRSRGIEPDQFTYEVMLRGYARAQHVRKLGEVMVHVDKEKQADSKLLRALAKVHDQRRVLYELEKAKLKKEQWEAEEANAKAQREKLRWAPPKFASLIEPKEEVSSEDEPRIKPLFAPGSTLGPKYGSVLKR